MRRLLVRFACLRHGHEPDLEDRDAYGRSVSCARCHCYDAQMAWWQWERFCGKQEIARHARQVAEEYTWVTYAAAMNGEWQAEERRLLAGLKRHMDPARYDEFIANLLRSEVDPDVAVRSF